MERSDPVGPDNTRHVAMPAARLPGLTPREKSVVESNAKESIAPSLQEYGTHLTAAVKLDDGTLDECLPAEELDPQAMPYLHPLQHAVDALPAIETPPDGLSGVRGTENDPLAGGLPLFNDD